MANVRRALNARADEGSREGQAGARGNLRLSGSERRLEVEISPCAAGGCGERNNPQAERQEDTRTQKRMGTATFPAKAIAKGRERGERRRRSAVGAERGSQAADARPTETGLSVSPAD